MENIMGLITTGFVVRPGIDFWDTVESNARKFKFKRDMKAKQIEANVYRNLGICLCVMLWPFCAMIVF